MKRTWVNRIELRRDGRGVVCDKKAIDRLYNNAGMGHVYGGKLFLSPVEVIYLVWDRRVKTVKEDGRSLGLNDLLRRLNSIDGGMATFIVYRYIRNKGMRVKESKGSLNVWERGMRPPRDRWSMRVFVRNERDIVTMEELIENSRRDVHYAIVDEEGDTTFYRISRFTFNKLKKDEIKIMTQREGFYSGGIVLSTDGLLMKYSEDTLVGKIMGNTVQFSLIEAKYLVDRGIMKMDEDISSLGNREQSYFEERYAVYSHLKDLGYIVKTGFKFGTHFRVYIHGLEEHAPYLVHVIPSGENMTWEEIARAVRVANGVNKEMIFATPEPRFVRIKWVKI